MGLLFIPRRYNYAYSEAEAKRPFGRCCSRPSFLPYITKGIREGRDENDWRMVQILRPVVLGGGEELQGFR